MNVWCLSTLTAKFPTWFYALGWTNKTFSRKRLSAGLLPSLSVFLLSFKHRGYACIWGGLRLVKPTNSCLGASRVKRCKAWGCRVPFSDLSSSCVLLTRPQPLSRVLTVSGYSTLQVASVTSSYLKGICTDDHTFLPIHCEMLKMNRKGRTQTRVFFHPVIPIFLGRHWVLKKLDHGVKSRVKTGFRAKPQASFSIEHFIRPETCKPQSNPLRH